MSGRNPSRPPWDTQGQPRVPADDKWYGVPQGPRVIIKPHEAPSRGGRQSQYATPAREGRRGRALAGAVIGLAAAVGLVAAAHQLTYVTWGKAPVAALIPSAAPPSDPTTPATTTPATTTPATTTPAATAPATPSSVPAAASTPSYVLAAPATAGGYTLTSPMSDTIKAVGSSAAGRLMSAVEAAGGKASGSTGGEYLITGDQALGYAGYNGTFSPAAVMTAFEAEASGVTTEPAGPHGGELACGDVTASSSAGTACVWATPTTVGMVEFFGGTALEHVLPARAGSDALKFRGDVEKLPPRRASPPSTPQA